MILLSRHLVSLLLILKLGISSRNKNVPLKSIFLQKTSMYRNFMYHHDHKLMLNNNFRHKLLHEVIFCLTDERIRGGPSVPLQNTKSKRRYIRWQIYRMIYYFKCNVQNLYRAR